MTTIGLLQYLAPTIQFALGLLVFHEAMTPVKWIGFALVWLALAIFTGEALRTTGVPSCGWRRRPAPSEGAVGFTGNLVNMSLTPRCNVGFRQFCGVSMAFGKPVPIHNPELWPGNPQPHSTLVADSVAAPERRAHGRACSTPTDCSCAGRRSSTVIATEISRPRDVRASS